MNKVFLFLVLLATLAFSQGNTHAVNWVWDTVSVDAILDSGEIGYTQAFQLEDGQPMRIVCLANDTSNGYTTFNGDSVEFDWGYQTGSRCFDSSYSTLDTCWDIRIKVDTYTADSLGKKHTGTADSKGVITRVNGDIDTSSIPGWATQSRIIVPEQDDFIRIYMLGNADNNLDSKIANRFLLRRRTYEPGGSPIR